MMSEAQPDRSRLTSFHEWVGTAGGIISILVAFGVLGGAVAGHVFVNAQPSEPSQPIVAQPPAFAARHTVENVHYTAIWKQGPGPPWLAYHGLTSAQYQQTFELTGKGFRLIQVSGCSMGKQEFFAVIFEQQEGPPLRAFYGLTATEYQQKFDELSGQGLRLVQVSGYSID